MESSSEKSSASPIGAWGTTATVVGLASDLLRPLGNFSLFLLVLCAAATVTLFIMSRRKPELRHSAGFAAIGVAVFGLVTLLQAISPADSAGVNRGFIASSVAPVASLQSAMLNVPAPAPRKSVAAPVVSPTGEPAPAPAPEQSPPKVAAQAVPIWTAPTTHEPADYDAALHVAMSDADAGNRVRAARFALSSADTAFQSAVIERLYRSPQPELRQVAITGIFQSRTGRAQFPLLIVEHKGNDAELVNQLQGASLYVSRVDEVTGGVVGSFAGGSLNGSIARTAVSFSTTLGNRGTATLSLKPTDDFSLQGNLRAQDGKTTQVQIPLM